MSAERYRVTEYQHSGLDFLQIERGGSTHELRAQTEDSMIVGAIRQQSADIAALKDALADEVNANEAFRKAGGARDDEDMPTFCARLIAERDQYRGQLFDCELALKMEHDLLCEKRAELAVAVAERDKRIAELEAVANHAQAVVKVCERDYKDRLRLMTARAEQAEARLSAIDSAPVVAVVREMKRDFASGPYKFLYYDSDKLPAGGTELIAKPAKD